MDVPGTQGWPGQAVLPQVLQPLVSRLTLQAFPSLSLVLSRDLVVRGDTSGPGPLSFGRRDLLPWSKDDQAGDSASPGLRKETDTS